MLQRGSHAVYELGDHFVWIPKRRRRLLQDRLARRLGELLQEIATDHGWQCRALSIRPDHVHVFLEAAPRWSPSEIIQRLKGITARQLFQEFPALRAGLPSGELWSDGYFVRGVGEKVTAQIVQHDIRYQDQQDRGVQLKLW